jgi:hypothetical protein
MDRVSLTWRRAAWLILGGAVLAVLAFKAMQLGWLAARPPLVLPDQPVALFFNNERGCECVLAIYRQADAEIDAWSRAAGVDLPLYRINLERRPGLGRRFGIRRAPTLLLLDAQGNEVWRQEDVLSDTHVFDLERAEAEVEALLAEAGE